MARIAGASFEFRAHFEIDITPFVSLKRTPRDSFYDQSIPVVSWVVYT